jgi:hypothetical protein
MKIAFLKPLSLAFIVCFKVIVALWWPKTAAATAAAKNK